MGYQVLTKVTKITAQKQAVSDDDKTDWDADEGATAKNC
jgi:hypothetical protein